MKTVEHVSKFKTYRKTAVVIIMLRMLILSTILLLTLTSTVSAEERKMTMDAMTGGMSTDIKEFFFEFLQWVIAIALIACAVRAISGYFTGNPAHTKQGLNGIVYIVIVVILYYAVTYSGQ